MKICCEATGESPLKYTWFFTSQAGGTSPTILTYEEYPTLTIIDAKKKDHQGSYHCRVTNGFGKDISGLLNIKVGKFYCHYTPSAWLPQDMTCRTNKHYIDQRKCMPCCIYPWNAWKSEN